MSEKKDYFDEIINSGLYREALAAMEKDRNKFSEILERLAKAEQENEKLIRFKKYVHDRLDKAGVPADPEPVNNAKHGCRIEGRLNYVFEQLRAEKEKIKVGDQMWYNAISVIAELQNKLHKFSEVKDAKKEKLK